MDLPVTSFFIGYNKCGTSSLHRWLTLHGVRSVHGGKSVNALLENEIILNLAFEQAPLKGLADHSAWLDFGIVQSEWRDFLRWYPDAKFVLNMRDMDHWVLSRLNHLYGRYVEYMNLFYRRKLTWQEWATEWRQEFIDHEAAVMAQFQGEANFLRFDIETGRMQDLASFLEIETTDFTLPFENVTKHKRFIMDGSEIRDSLA